MSLYATFCTTQRSCACHRLYTIDFDRNLTREESSNSYSKIPYVHKFVRTILVTEIMLIICGRESLLAKHP